MHFEIHGVPSHALCITTGTLDYKEKFGPGLYMSWVWEGGVLRYVNVIQFVSLVLYFPSIIFTSSNFHCVGKSIMKYQHKVD